MKQIIGKVYYDRKKTSKRRGVGTVELYFRLNDHCKKYLTILNNIAPKDWILLQDTREFKNRVKHYVDIVNVMIAQEMELSLHNLNYCFGLTDEKPVDYNDSWRHKKPVYLNFIDFMRDKIMEEDAPYNTRKQQLCVLKSLEDYKNITYFTDLTIENIIAYDKWLKQDQKRTDVTVYTYHKYLRKYSRIAYEYDLIKECPYNKYHVVKGKSPERNPLNESELETLRNIKLSGHLERARDMFIFSAYTGLAYCDVIAFDFQKMSELYDGQYFIDGARIKTKSKFFTPILPPAMAVLKKYRYHLPHISNQKCNDYLEIIRSMTDISKKITFHIARHSFATQALANDIPVDKVARMLGHKDVKTTQIYAKVLKDTVAKHADRWAESLQNKEAKVDSKDSDNQDSQSAKKSKQPRSSSKQHQSLNNQKNSQSSQSSGTIYPELFTSISYTYV